MCRENRQPIQRGPDERVVILLAHDDPNTVYSLSGLLRERGCLIIGPLFDPADTIPIAVTIFPDIVLIGGMDRVSPALSRGLRARFPGAGIVAFDPELRSDENGGGAGPGQAGLDLVLAGDLSHSAIISRLQILLGSRNADIADAPSFCRASAKTASPPPSQNKIDFIET